MTLTCKETENKNSRRENEPKMPKKSVPISREEVAALDAEIVQVFAELDKVNKELFDN